VRPGICVLWFLVRERSVSGVPANGRSREPVTGYAGPSHTTSDRRRPDETFSPSPSSTDGWPRPSTHPTRTKRARTASRVSSPTNPSVSTTATTTVADRGRSHAFGAFRSGLFAAVDARQNIYVTW